MEKEALLLAGKLAMAAEKVIQSNAIMLSLAIHELKVAMDNYNAHIFSNLPTKQAE